MVSPQSTSDTLFLALPIGVMLLLAFFRLDELLARPRLRSVQGHPLSHRGDDGQSICIEPDGHYLGVPAGGPHAACLRRMPGHRPRRSAIPPVPRISVDWNEGSEE